MPRWLAATLALSGTLLLIATIVLVVAQQREVSALRGDLDRLRDRLDELQSEQEAETPTSSAGEDPSEDDPRFDELASAAELAACVGEGALSGADPIEADTLAGQLDAIEARVQRLRGLEAADPVEPQMLDSEAFRARVAASLWAHYPAEDAQHDGRLLSALGAVESGTDLRGLLEELLGDQVVGFYDEDAGELVLRRDDPGALLSSEEQVTYAHEVQHALADERLGLPAAIHQPTAESDAALGGQALAEGDAVLTMQRFASTALGMGDRLAMAGEGLRQQQQLASYPQFLQPSLTFPYEQGLALVCHLYEQRGWAAVDAAYDRPPTTSAQVLFPARYAAAQPAAEPPALDDPGRRWAESDTDTLGAAPLSWLFAAPGDDPAAGLDQPRQRVSAWAGGQVTLWTAGEDTAVGVALAGHGGDPTLCESVTSWYTAAFPDSEPADRRPGERLALTGPEQDAAVVCEADDVRLGIAPDLATARAIAGPPGG